MLNWYENAELHDEDYVTLSSLMAEDDFFDPWNEDSSVELYDD